AGFVTSAGARTFLDRFHHVESGYVDDLAALPDLDARRKLITGWLSAFRAANPASGTEDDLVEAVAIELTGPAFARYDSAAGPTRGGEGLVGVHPRSGGGRRGFRLDRFLAATRAFGETWVPGFRSYGKKRSALPASERPRLRLDDFRPSVLTAFV